MKPPTTVAELNAAMLEAAALLQLELLMALEEEEVFEATYRRGDKYVIDGFEFKIAPWPPKP